MKNTIENLEDTIDLMTCGEIEKAKNRIFLLTIKAVANEQFYAVEYLMKLYELCQTSKRIDEIMMGFMKIIDERSKKINSIVDNPPRYGEKEE